MWSLGPVGFLSPWLLAGLVLLPVLWLILRAVPPAPLRRRFPGVALLLGLQDRESQSDRTPWWLLLLRILAVAAAIIGFAGPVLNPAERGAPGSGPLLILADGTWADARDWPVRLARIEALLGEARRANRPAAVVTLSNPPPETRFDPAEAVLTTLPGVAPHPWEPDPQALADWTASLEGRFETIWLSDGLARDNRAALLDTLEAHGSVRVIQTPRRILALRPPRLDSTEIALEAVRTPIGGAAQASIAAHGLDPAGIERRLATATLSFAPGDAVAQAALALPPELRNRVTRFEIEGARSAAAVALTDDALRRREIGLVESRETREAAELMSPLHYLRVALEPQAELISGDLPTLIPANPDVIVLADAGALPPSEAEALQVWVESGGLLLRFAGPRLAASDAGRDGDDPLMPVRLRVGGRSVGGTMSWGEPKTIAPFEADSPFFGLAVPGDVTVRAQVVAQPGPDLAARVIAQLSDGTPLVTRKPLGDGQVVLVHVTANAEWSSLPLSGLFVSMLERLAISARTDPDAATDLAGTSWQAVEIMDAEGALTETDTRAAVPGEALAAGDLGPDLPPGLYAGEAGRFALNVTRADTTLAPARWPARIAVEGLERPAERPLAGLLLALALALMAIDALASLAVGGRLRARAALLLMALVLPPVPGAQAQEPPMDPQAEAFAQAATGSVVLGYILSGDAQVDEVARQGLEGLGRALWQRTSVEPAAPMEVDPETDELSFFPLLYWPITGTTPIPSEAAYDRLNAYLRGGGMIVFDTRDAGIAGLGAATPEGRRLQAIARPLDVPPLSPVPEDHVLTRTFYLLQDFPGRHQGRDVWVEAAPEEEPTPGMPFRNLNDNVTPVVIGGNDWAAAWAMNPVGMPLYPVGRGMAGERQREMAYRFGVNLVMHVLTGNYKSDQVHVPALLERLGQ
ncbi:LOW QUALITY PROTEIN: membrane protein, putative [Limimaricola cinnabarinus LL-001]|uniref:Membrane protein, putative n=1 Tax=Limimaricola cinnabarinus LL-001 TaxID=1337093 RepID=U2YJJ7_9RHOB|nr:LOW QUALITY PROTEIN: membrane protein, putative [Limimaricola cinnabarinus LL-001]